MAKKIFLAATRQNDGKTMVAIGLISAFMAKSDGRVGFIKPVGQRYVEVGSHKVDEDSLLVHEIWDMKTDIQHMSPIAIKRGFTAEYIRSGGPLDPLIEKIKASYEIASKGKEIVVIEGTGHAGVGSCFDLSNATVAKLLGAKVVLVTVGGIGRPIDEIVLNRALFEKAGVEVLGVILNKVQPDKYDRVREIAGMGLKRLGIELLGTIPYREVLSSPTMGELLEETRGDLLNGKDSLDRRVSRISVGAMTPHHALAHFTSETLVITPGDREDIILAAISKAGFRRRSEHAVAGLMLTGDDLPHASVTRLISRTRIPVIHIPQDTYTVAAKIHDIIVKIHPSEKDKIEIAKRIVGKHVSATRILKKIE